MIISISTLPFKLAAIFGMTLFQNLTNQRVSVRMRATRSKAKDSIAFRNGLAVYNTIFFNHAYSEACKIIFMISKYIPGISAVSPPIKAHPACSHPIGNTLDYSGCNINIQSATGKIIKKE